ncbi:fatty acid elongase [Saccharomycopsis crataegensis]|uniref:Elongation of fatty acids protein n=1 Tax=Saccharomycopsis crataegensis TaxID=43959 RepID=A0AAV5QQ89_9ASCO|nr:fatty acid elongase [Saccharomycopsis crataegensis]
MSNFLEKPIGDLFFPPTIDHPFGINLWELFNEVVSKATGNAFVPKEFEFEYQKSPLSHLPPVLSIIALYYTVIFGGDYVWKKNKWAPLKLKLISQVHNIILTVISFTLLVLMIEQLFPIIVRHGLYYAICDMGSWTQPMVTLYYLNYLTKFVEFLDTVLLVLKQKKLTFLHTYHHGATALLCYTQLVGKTPISWIVIGLNLAVHCVMYWYYFLSSIGIRVWWKEWVTRFQIIQFILDLSFVYFATYQKVANDFFADVLPHCANCAGSMYAAAWGCCILSSYLVLFIAFYIEVYRKRDTKKSKVVRRARGGVAAKVNEYVQVDLTNATGYSPSPMGRKDIPKKRKV